MDYAEYEKKHKTEVRESTTDRIAIIVQLTAEGRQVHMPLTPTQCLAVARQLERIGMKYAERVEGVPF